MHSGLNQGNQMDTKQRIRPEILNLMFSNSFAHDTEQEGEKINRNPNFMDTGT